MTEVEIKLNVHEIGVILSALQLLENRDENHIAREYGSVPALHSKLSLLMDQMDTSETGLRNDVVPSFWSILRTSTKPDRSWLLKKTVSLLIFCSTNFSLIPTLIWLIFMILIVVMITYNSTNCLCSNGNGRTVTERNQCSIVTDGRCWFGEYEIASHHFWINCPTC